WTKASPDPIGSYQSDPANYLTLRWANLPSKDGVVHAVVEDSAGGLGAQYESGGKWQSLGLSPNPGTFGSNDPSPDCAPQDDQCFNSGPSYYETLRFGDIVGDGNHAEPEALGRLNDGLRVWQLAGDGSAWSRLAT